MRKILKKIGNTKNASKPKKETIADYLYGRDGNRCVFLADELVKSNPRLTLGEFREVLEAVEDDVMSDEADIIVAAVVREEGRISDFDERCDVIAQETYLCLSVLWEVIDDFGYGQDALLLDKFTWDE